MKLDPDLDRQPEADLPTATLVSLSLGLILSAGVILFAGIGAILGHHLLHDAFGLGQDILIGALAGIILSALFIIELVSMVSGRIRRRAGM